MGLPYWTVPAPIDTKEANKTDVSAARRSPIRRRYSPARLHRSNTLRRAGPTRAEALSPPIPTANIPDLGPEYTWQWAQSPRSISEYGGRTQGLWSNPPPPAISSTWDVSQASRDLSRTPTGDRHLHVPESNSVTSYPDGSRSTPHNGPGDGASSRALRPLGVRSSSRDPLEHALQHLAPLRRMGRRNVADGPLPASSLRESWEANATSGLGDRERSISPAADDGADAWDTMLTTIAPDQQLPSFDSSFTSAAASASASFSAGRSNNNSQSRSGSGTRSSSASQSSSRTHITVPSPTFAPVRSTDLECTTDNEHSFDSGSDTEDDAEILAASERLARIRHPRSPPSHRSQGRSTAEMREALRNRPFRLSAVRQTPSYQAAVERVGHEGVEAHLRRIEGRNQRDRMRERQRLQPSNHPDEGDLDRLHEHSRELDRQFEELRNISDDLGRRQREFEQTDRMVRELDEARLHLTGGVNSRPGSRYDALVDEQGRLVPNSRRQMQRILANPERTSTGLNTRPRPPRSDRALTEDEAAVTAVETPEDTNDPEREQDASRFISHFESFRAARDASRRDQREATERRVHAENNLLAEVAAAASTLDSSRPLSPETEAIWDRLAARVANNTSADASAAASVRGGDPTLSRDEMLGNDPELEGMRAILERMSRRDDIPQWWWESAGLSTAIPRGRL